MIINNESKDARQREVGSPITVVDGERYVFESMGFLPRWMKTSG
jgi:hypothetical protein